MNTTPSEYKEVAEPIWIRLPKTGCDPMLGLNRSAFYELEKRGVLKLHRLKKPGRQRGITLINFAEAREAIRAELNRTNA